MLTLFAALMLAGVCRGFKAFSRFRFLSWSVLRIMPACSCCLRCFFLPPAASRRHASRRSFVGSSDQRFLANARGIIGLAREPAAEAVVGFQITDLPLVGHGILQDAHQAHGDRWPRVVLGLIELARELVGGD